MMKSLSKAPNIVSSLKNKVKFPNRFQGTMFKKWAEYWKNLFADYRQMLQDLRTDIQDDPMKAMKWTAGLGTLCLLSMKNPDELDFKDYLKRINNETVMLSPDCLNPKTVEHLSYLDTCYNQGTIHYKITSTGEAAVPARRSVSGRGRCSSACTAPDTTSSDTPSHPHTSTSCTHTRQSAGYTFRPHASNY
uniref:SFRICE_023364 n=1 Tax=Spodoptera frugiperda TaxID=7108 RepID=A0A2H1WSQ3_SPOFR